MTVFFLYGNNLFRLGAPAATEDERGPKTNDKVVSFNSGLHIFELEDESTCSSTSKTSSNSSSSSFSRPNEDEIERVLRKSEDSAIVIIENQMGVFRSKRRGSNGSGGSNGIHSTDGRSYWRCPVKPNNEMGVLAADTRRSLGLEQGVSHALSAATRRSLSGCMDQDSIPNLTFGLDSVVSEVMVELNHLGDVEYMTDLLEVEDLGLSIGNAVEAWVIGRKEDLQKTFRARRLSRKNSKNS